jgi:hypothetical protein
MVTITNMAVKLYYEDCKNVRINRAMEQVKKKHYLTFCKHLPVCDSSLGIESLQEIQAHYDNNLKLEMLTEKLQMLMYSSMNKEQNASCLR